MSFTEDNLLVANGPITHHGANVTADEEMSPTLENTVVLTWLKLIHTALPALVKQRYGTELRSKTLASLKPEISQALDSLLEEIRSTADTKVLRTTASRFRQPPSRPSHKPSPSSWAPTKRPKSCPLCKQAGRNDQHFLSSCSYLPSEDRTYLSRSRFMSTFDDEEPDYMDYAPPLFTAEDEPPLCTPARSVSRRVSTKQSPHFKAFYKHYPIQLTLDTGAETSMIKSSLARSIGAPIMKSSQQALQADGLTSLAVVGETRLILSRADNQLTLDALVVDDLDVDVLAGTPFLIANDISVRPAKCQVRIQDSEVVHYEHKSDPTTASHAVRRAQCYTLRAPPSTTVLWPGDYVELDVPPDLGDDCVLALQPRTDTPVPKYTNPSSIWPEPQIVEAVGAKVCLVNSSQEPKLIGRHEHLNQILPTEETSSFTSTPSLPSLPQPVKPKSSLPFSSSVSIDPDNILSEDLRVKLQQLLQTYDRVFSPDITGYNGAAGPIQASVNIGPVQPPQRKGLVPQYSRNQLVELQAKFDELEQAEVFRRPEDLGITVEYLNPSFLVKKPSGGYKLVTAFADVARYSKPQPSLMPDVDSTLRTIAPWRYMIKTDLTRAFYKIPLSKSSLKYCGLATPFRGTRVYTRSAMGMPGSETALEEMMCRVLGDFIEEGFVAKLADDLYYGAFPKALLHNWQRVLQALDRCNLRLSPTKTVICPKTTTILGWIWSQGRLSANPHRIAALASCLLPSTVKGLRSFIAAYEVLSRVLPNCSNVTGLQSSDRLMWSENLTSRFKSAQDFLSNHKAIVLPRPSDTLCIVTDGSVTRRGIGATLYVSRVNQLHLAGFFSAKLRKHQVTWLPCEVEALSIAASVKHFSPFIIQSQHPTTVLTDSKPCVQAIEKLCRGEFSASPRVTSFLTTVSRYQVHLQHLAGRANLPSDFTSRNAPDCSEPNCQICNFVHEMEDSVVRNVSIHDILNNKSNLPFTSKSAWRQIQNHCPDLRRVHAHLKQGTRPSKKLTNVRDVKRYLNSVSIASNVAIEVGCVKNKNKNPVAEKAVYELEEELLKQEPGGRPVSAVGFALATARLNSRLRLPGLSSRELWTQRNQFTHEQLPLSDYNFILDKHAQRSTNHAFSEKSKNPHGLVPNTPSLHVGDIVYLISDKDKSHARDR